MSSSPTNLLIQLLRWAIRQDENFTTEAFVHLLNHLVACQPSSARRILAHLTGNRFPQLASIPLEVAIITQVITDQGTPDIRIAAPGFLGYVEVKLGAALGIGQLSSYRLSLNHSGVPATCLTLLTRYPHDTDAEDQPDAAIRWFQVAGRLEYELDSGTLDQTSAYLIEQFLGYLEALSITIRQVRSGISEGLRDFTNWHGSTIASLGRLRSPQQLATYPELVPLHNLVMLLGESLAGTGLNIKFDSGQQSGGWIGYNLGNMDYFLFVYYSRPEVLVFEMYHRKFDPLLWDGTIGEYGKDLKPPRWQNRLDLTSPKLGIFALPKEEQMAVIDRFIKESLAVADSCSPG